VYWTTPRTEPPGGTFKCEILHGFSLEPPEEIDAIIRAASDEFQGTSYNLLAKNCNHFTAYLCQKLTGRPSPNWLNRAASIGVALPCIVPRDWLEPPDYENTEGALLDDDDNADEHSLMLRQPQEELHLLDSDSEVLTPWANEEGYPHASKGKSPLRDTAGRVLPRSEIAPGPRR
jgi:deubiquitinase DESI2